MKGRLLLVVCLIIALWMAFVFANHNQHYHFSLPTFNLKGVPALAQSIDQAQASGSYVVTGTPTISIDLINRVLASASSPAAGTGQAMYNLGVMYGIDPVFALAFFQLESGYGTAGMARATRSLGNLRCTAGYACNQGYAAFPSWQAGYEAWFKLIKNVYVSKWGLRTVSQIVPKYAPARDHNSPSSYINAVENSVDSWRGGRI